MGTNLSGNNSMALVWLEAHIGPWVANPASIGLTSAQTTDLAVDIINARAAFTTVEAVRVESKDKTSVFKTRADLMRRNAAPLIANIKNFAANAADPSVVYTAANIEQADPRSPVAPPSQPTALIAEITSVGGVTINFEGTGPSGTDWIIKRKLALETSYSQIGFADVTTKSFTDNTVAQGTDSASYVVQGVRSGNFGLASPILTVTFGTADGAAQEAA